MAEKEQKLSEKRTEWSEDRTILSNERTFASWMRTGMASLAIGIGLQAVFRAAEPTWIAKAAASVFVLISLLIFWVAWINACKKLARLDSHVAEPLSRTHFKSIAGVLALGSVVTGVVLWLT